MPLQPCLATLADACGEGRWDGVEKAAPGLAMRLHGEMLLRATETP